MSSIALWGAVALPREDANKQGGDGGAGDGRGNGQEVSVRP